MASAELVGKEPTPPPPFSMLELSKEEHEDLKDLLGKINPDMFEEYVGRRQHNDTIYHIYWVLDELSKGCNTSKKH